MDNGWARPLKIAKHLDFSLRHIYELVAQGELEGSKRGNTMRISWASVQDFLNRYRVTASEEGGKNF